ncbi:MAG: 2-hydroxyacid dehydrogenase [Coriobacteriales bacterium]|jgi:phosphoglycerate dehydrogenase-like enzyme|nr:2-hydroxyacid dehydrogenase [Coriobacteriales bacterium]
MKLLVIGDRARVEKYLPALEVTEQVERVVVARGTSDEDMFEAASDADFVLADAISPVSAALIDHMPKLRLIHSEGVAYNAIDLAAARRRGIPVCNCKGVNAGAVAEQAVLLMLAVLRDVLGGDRAVRQGRQIQTKERMMTEGIRELGDCKIGFLGAGDIASATMARLAAWGCEMAYYKRTPLTDEQERRLGARFEPLETMLATSDIVSLHVPVTDETQGMVDEGFLKAMCAGGILINTARGEIVDQEALAAALVSGHLAAAGLDTLYPEPVAADHPLLGLPDGASERIVFSPHVGGITEGTFYRAHRSIWENIARAIVGEPLRNVVS